MTIVIYFISIHFQLKLTIEIYLNEEVSNLTHLLSIESQKRKRKYHHKCIL